jgi:hypothetical protein
MSEPELFSAGPIVDLAEGYDPSCFDYFNYDECLNCGIVVS